MWGSLIPQAPFFFLPKPCWIIVMTVDIPVLFLILEEVLSVFHYWKLHLLWVCHMWPFSVEIGSLYLPTFWRILNHDWVLNFVKRFFCIYWDDHMVFLFFSFLMWCITLIDSFHFISVQLLSRVRLFAARQASLSITNSWSPSKCMSIESMMPCNHLNLCHPLLLLPSIFSSIRVFSNESALHIRWPKY